MPSNKGEAGIEAVTVDAELSDEEMTGIYPRYDGDGGSDELDLTGTKRFEFKLLPVGTYDVVVRKYEDKKSSNGNRMFLFVLAVDGGEYDGQPLFHYAAVTDKNMGRVAETFDAILGETVGRIRPSAELFIGKRCRVIVKHEEFPKGTGEMRNRVQRLLPDRRGESGEQGLF